jgi:hypothetical protein
METISLPSSLRSSFKCDHIGAGSTCLDVSLFDHRALKSADTKLLRISEPEKVTGDSFGRLCRPRPFSQLGFSEVALW